MIAVIGAGAFGTGLAVALARKHEVRLWARNPDHVAAMRADRANHARLPGIALPERVVPTQDLALAAEAEILLLALPMQQLSGMLTDHAGRFAGKVLVATCKGLDLDSLAGPVDLIERRLPGCRAAQLTGPSFASEIAEGKPTALTLAARDPALGRALQEALTTPTLRLYRSTDVIGAQLGGALKNVIAIAAGVVIGAGLGASARAALITRGFAEMQNLAGALGAEPETLAGLSGLGDLILTCTSEQSRNYSFGQALGRGEHFASTITVEGTATARAAHRLAGQHGLDMPVLAAVVAVLEDPGALNDTIDALLSRPLKPE
ncbi:NAD(P)H-dependent glycerol-3-phosphate dehydrogenase [Poseidonocella sedimentorum]|uniref:Glycerol-3-phosphate dehydrogenase [NAD(P)+] n=1 Tax=Poseidonocella sedimentorum TaxID=871652 RepID=A0A1I6D8W5_9RHOB|nr:NAD(P)H-dependent glycerol-3-phosphate dehydrogenase [Poseidonocella sedimentorum]SFR01896.1 glycerol-3-phosphate dehydrogenase (NAD(P)+) [Poseidonocella sedimentorum]